MTRSSTPAVHLLSQPAYDQDSLLPAAAECLDRSLPRAIRNSTVLLKPNFISRQNAFLSCTHPALIESVCAYFSGGGNRILVGDSPAFGSAAHVAAALGLPRRLAPYGARIVELKRSRPVSPRSDKGPALARIPEEVELLVNLPRLKAHKQMALSGATKNLFGLVPGVTKALAHVRHGQSQASFARMILDLLPDCPESVSLLDGVRAMQRSGPTDGDPYDCGILGASRDPIALDTAISCALGLSEDEVPLWRVARERALPGADPDAIAYTGKRPEQVRCGMTIPRALSPISFHPLRLAKSICQRGLARLRPTG
jgi:uncharacterized protein (DUF362 family)